MAAFDEIQILLEERAEIRSRLGLLPYDGTPEIKEVGGQRYLYVRKRELGRVLSTYVGSYSDDLYNLLLRNANEAKALNKRIRQIERRLAVLGYSEEEVSPRVLLNIDFARANLKNIIYDQAILEGVATTFPDTEAILESGKVNNMTAEDTLKILNLKHAWEFILDKQVANSPTDYYLSSHIAKLINEGFYHDGGRIRHVPVTIGGSNYVPPLPLEFEVKETIANLLKQEKEKEEIAIDLLLYVMKTQIYLDGNKRTAVILANHYMIGHGLGLIVIPYDKVSEFKRLLVDYYEDKDLNGVRVFLRNCILTF